MILKLEKSPLIPWKKGRGGRRERRKRESWVEVDIQGYIWVYRICTVTYPSS